MKSLIVMFLRVCLDRTGPRCLKDVQAATSLSLNTLRVEELIERLQYMNTIEQIFQTKLKYGSTNEMNFILIY